MTTVNEEMVFHTSIGIIIFTDEIIQNGELVTDGNYIDKVCRWIPHTKPYHKGYSYVVERVAGKA